MDDAAFKKLFSHKRMIELLIRRHVPQWDEKIDYSTLERLPAELIDDRLRRRYPDMLWRACTIDGSIDMILLLEFQGRPERAMVLRTTAYSVLAVQELMEHDRELGRGERQLAIESLVLHHGDRRWNAPTRLRDLFQDSAPDTHRVVEPLPLDAAPSGPLDLPQMILGLGGLGAETEMIKHVRTLRRVVDSCVDEDFDPFMARGLKAMLRSKGFDTDRLKEAMTMGAVETEFGRGWDAVRQQGIEAGQLTLLRLQAARKFGRETADELTRLLTRTPDDEQVGRVAAAIVDCNAADDFLARVRGDG
ncbi:MAG: Rpn family recombination-promoting nuclease/putative transposase [Gemmatimonadetes bacterium]|nr:Rpn family recombination-promoting nuclease/putative transposase [Gemmatimonadota bacterium]MYC91430.1 Rpn family recombination-promoting nuclease/putative transposase [Gemmatimonadota bacterium]MYJ17453.1 Rpn family recombination-promoting nuclease/putative transposase [Gemmatimonadota bacterium]